MRVFLEIEIQQGSTATYYSCTAVQLGIAATPAATLVCMNVHLYWYGIRVVCNQEKQAYLGCIGSDKLALSPKAYT